MSDGDRHLLDPAFPDDRWALCDVTAVGPGTYFPAQVTCQACLDARVERREADPAGYDADLVIRADAHDRFAPEAADNLLGTRVPFLREDGRRMKPEVTAAVLESDGKAILVTLHHPDRLALS